MKVQGIEQHIKFNVYSLATGTEEAPSSMVSSEAESEASVLSEQPDQPLLESGDQLDMGGALSSGNWKNGSSTVSSGVSTRGKQHFVDVVNVINISYAKCEIKALYYKLITL